MTKVAIFTSSLSGGGMERAMINVATFLSKEGATVDFLVASTKGPLLEEASKNTNLVDLSNKKGSKLSFRWWLAKSVLTVEPAFIMLLFIRKLPKSIKIIPSIVEYISQHSPDVILSTPTNTNMAILWAAHYCNFKKKIIVREATTLSQELERTQTTFNKFVKRLIPKWYNRSYAVIGVSSGVCQDLVKNFDIDNDRIRELPNLIDIDGINVRANSNEHEHLIDSYRPFILSVGRLDDTKNYEILIRAYKEIYKNTRCSLVILGEGPDRLKLEKLVSKLSLYDRVYLPGFYKNPYPFIKNCEVFALSSKQEGSPNVLREAQVLNKKIVSTDCSSGIHDILGDSKCARLAPVGDFKMLAQQILELMTEENCNNSPLVEHVNTSSMRAYKLLCLESA